MIDDDIILRVNSISKSFSRKIKSSDNHNSYESNELLRNFNLNLNRGKITALIGGNGSGKTTLFNIITGFISPDSGDVFFFNGKNHMISKQKPHEISRLGIGRLFQEAQIFPELTVFDNMLIADDNKFGTSPFDSIIRAKKNRIVENNRKERATKILISLFGDNNDFINAKNSLAKNLSYGQQRLLGIARLFMSDYKLILLDEPTSGVNPNLHLSLLKSIKKFVDDFKGTVFIIEHNMQFVEQIADYCAFLNEGSIQTFGSTEEVINDENVKMNYLGF